MKELPRPLVQQDVDAAYEHFARRACEVINDEQQQAHPQVFFVQMSDSEVGVIESVRAVDPKFVAYMLNQGGPGKQALASVVAATLGERSESPFPMREAAMASGVRPDLAVQLSEAWMASELPRDDPARKLEPSVRLDRAECLLVLVHSKGRTAGQLMPIQTTDGQRHVEYRSLAKDGSARLGGEMAMQKWDDVPEDERP